MSNLEVRQFHSFLEELIDESFQTGRFSIDRIVSAVITKHPDKLTGIQAHLNDLGLRVLIRNNCRAKNKASSSDSGPDMFGHYGLGKRVAVPYIDDKGKRRWDRKPRSELTFADLDRIRARRDDRPSKHSKEQRDYDDIASRTERYREMTSSVAEALAMADRDGR